MAKKNGRRLVYKPKKLIPGQEIEAGLTGYYVAVPNRGYKGKGFLIRYLYPKVKDGQLIYGLIEENVEDWNRAERFRSFMDKWGRGAYTLGYFKVADSL